MISKLPGTEKSIKIQAILALLFVFASIQVSVGATKFMPNGGQWPEDILYKANLPSGAFFLEKDEITYFFFDQNALHQVWHNFKPSAIINNQVFKVKFIGSTGPTSVDNTGTQSSEYYNYFLGNDPTKWASHLHSTDAITMRNLWPGIDLIVQTSGDGVKYTFKVKPHSDPRLIKLQYVGAEGTYIDENDSLHITAKYASITEQPPFAYQNTKGFFKTNAEFSQVNVQYQQLEQNLIGFNVNNYSKRDTLIIDPIVVFSTFSGSHADNFGFTGTFNLEGNGYSGGTVYDPGFPTTPGAFQVNYQGGYTTYDRFGQWDGREYGRDVGILKYSPDGTKLVWATYLGGSNNEQPHSMIVDSKGDLIIFGTTASTNFPITSGAYQSSNGGYEDIYISKLSSDGTTLLASTYVGGKGWDGYNGTNPYPTNPREPTGPLAFNYGDAYRGEVIVDKSDNILVATCTQSSDLKTLNPFQMSFGGVQDGLVMKLSPDLSQLIWMSFLGGKDQDAAYGLHLDEQGNIFVCGGTQSSDFPTTPGTISPTYNGDRDGFLVKLSPDGKKILASTFMGTTSYDQNYLVQTDGSNFVYVTGQTLGSFPVTANAYSETPNGKNYIQKIDNNLSKVLISTVIGSKKASPNDPVNLSPSAFLVDLCGRVYISGWGGMVNGEYNSGNNGNTNYMPVTSDAYQGTTNGSTFYLAILSKDMTNLVYATYFGGLGDGDEEHVDGGTSRFDRNGIVYQSVCGGCAGNSDFPTTPNAWSRTNNGIRALYKNVIGCNNAMFKIDLNSADFPPRFNDTLIVKQVGQSIDYTFDIIDPQGDSVYASASSIIFNPKFVTTAATFKVDSGIGKITAHLTWVTDCNHYLGDTIVITVTAHNNSCPVPRTSTHYIRIALKQPDIPPVPDMFCIEHLDANTVKINWDAISNPKNLGEVRLVKIFPDQHVQILKTSSGLVPDSYIDPNAFDNLDSNYSYFLYSVSACGGIHDTGRIASTIPEKDSIPKSDDIYTVSVEKNQFVRVIWGKYASGNFFRYFLYRKDNDPNASYKLYTVFKSASDTSFLDSDVNVQTNSYCYKLLVESQCGIFSKDGNYGCSILLTGSSVPFINSLSWNQYQKWDPGVKIYNIYRRDPSKPDSLINTNSGNATTYVDDSLNYDEGIYWYHVEATENSPGAAKSVSNEIKLVQAPILYVPNAFTPNGDERNDKWLTVPVFVKDYHIHVYNRWGEYIWHSDVKHQLWDGTYKNGPASNDCFIWLVEYTGWDGSENYRHGYVTTLP